MPAALARAAARQLSCGPADFAGRSLRHRVLLAGHGKAPDDRNSCALARISSGILCTAAPELAHDPLAARQSLVRERSLAGTAHPDRPNIVPRRFQSEASISSMSSSLNPKWWPISWIRT